MVAGEIRASPYCKGVWFVNDQEWMIGERYQLVKLLGHGSFSSVCLGIDSYTGEKVALKRIPDVLSSPDQAKRVLREVCILRRLRHPFLINLRDAFTRPASCGPRKLVDGRLQSSSLDVYIAMEFGSDGDLFNFKGQMPAEEVTLIMWQLLHALKFLHSNNVWHRDIKSSNVMLTRAKGHRIVKVADFGSARSAISEGYHWAEQNPPTSQNPFIKQRPQERTGPLQPVLVHSDSFSLTAGNEQNINPKDLYVRPGADTGSPTRGRGCGAGFASPLTRMVATPCYRAPEVVMSRGGYTSAIDMWSMGCIFGELLQRVARVGSATTPHLQVAPLFAMHGGIPKTPSEGERYVAGPSNSVTRKELGALFDVIGTPSWADVGSVQSPTWRTYLQKLPIRAPTLFRRLGYAGEPAVHLLERMLAFDPERRLSAEEALTHEYFASLESSAIDDLDTSMESVSLDEGMEQTDAESWAEDRSKRARAAAAGSATSEMRMAVDAAVEMQQVAKKARSVPGSLSQSFSNMDLDRGESPRVRSLRDASPLLRRHYYEEADPDRALAMLEDEMSAAVPHDDGMERRSDAANRSTVGLDTLRALLERECEAQAIAGAAQVQAVKQQRARLAAEAEAAGAGADDEDNVLIHWVRSAADMRLKEDIHAKLQSGEDYGAERLAYVADTWKGRLDPAEHLEPGRHQEWTLDSGQGPPAGPTWGVASIPPGVDANDPQIRNIMRQQQLR